MHILAQSLAISILKELRYGQEKKFRIARLTVPICEDLKKFLENRLSHYSVQVEFPNIEVDHCRIVVLTPKEF